MITRTSVYNSISIKGRSGSGSLLFTDESLAWHQDKGTREVIEVEWSQVEKVSANVPSSSTAMLRVRINSQGAVDANSFVFKFPSRPQMEEAKADMEERILQALKEEQNDQETFVPLPFVSLVSELEDSCKYERQEKEDARWKPSSSTSKRESTKPTRSSSRRPSQPAHPPRPLPMPKARSNSQRIRRATSSDIQSRPRPSLVTALDDIDERPRSTNSGKTMRRARSNVSQSDRQLMASVSERGFITGTGQGQGQEPRRKSSMRRSNSASVVERQPQPSSLHRHLSKNACNNNTSYATRATDTVASYSSNASEITNPTAFTPPPTTTMIRVLPDNQIMVSSRDPNDTSAQFQDQYLVDLSTAQQHLTENRSQTTNSHPSIPMMVSMDHYQDSRFVRSHSDPYMDMSAPVMPSTTTRPRLERFPSQQRVASDPSLFDFSLQGAHTHRRQSHAQQLGGTSSQRNYQWDNHPSETTLNHSSRRSMPQVGSTGMHLPSEAALNHSSRRHTIFGRPLAPLAMEQYQHPHDTIDHRRRRYSDEYDDIETGYAADRRQDKPTRKDSVRRSAPPPKRRSSKKDLQDDSSDDSSDDAPVRKKDTGRRNKPRRSSSKQTLDSDDDSESNEAPRRKKDRRGSKRSNSRKSVDWEESRSDGSDSDIEDPIPRKRTTKKGKDKPKSRSKSKRKDDDDESQDTVGCSRKCCRCTLVCCVLLVCLAIVAVVVLVFVMGIFNGDSDSASSLSFDDDFYEFATDDMLNNLITGT